MLGAIGNQTVLQVLHAEHGFGSQTIVKRIINTLLLVHQSVSKSLPQFYLASRVHSFADF